MRTSSSIAPHDQEQDTYLVLDDFGHHGRLWRANESAADRETVIRDLLAGEYHYPLRIVAFNTTEGWSRDVTFMKWPDALAKTMRYRIRSFSL
jgi:hypothetical protein